MKHCLFALGCRIIRIVKYFSSDAITALAILLFLFPIESDAFADQSLLDKVREGLRARIEAAGVPPRITVGKELIHATVVLPRFYHERIYQPAWVGSAGPLSQVDGLVQAIRDADKYGLRPSDYHIDQIEANLTQVRRNKAAQLALNPLRLVDLELLLTDSFLIYASHLQSGRLNPVTVDPEWHADRKEANIAAVLSKAIEDNQIEVALQNFLPNHLGFSSLSRALNQYRNIAAKGGWSKVPDGRKLQKGDRDSRVVLLRSRLRVTADYQGQDDADLEYFDNAIEEGIKRFQLRHGLDVDGVVGPKTLSALNVPVEERIRQIEGNLERRRWLPQDLGNRFILVNIADFTLKVVEDGHDRLTMQVVVGRYYRRTPVFSGKMTYLVFSPRWNIPHRVAIIDKLPLIRDEPDYLSKNGIRVFQDWGTNAVEINPTSIDWSRVTSQNFPYRLGQEPGPKNALGRVKFMFPNRFDVYLHDTPSRELFLKTVRAFSSGCIRVEKPIELAEYLLQGRPEWSQETILSFFDQWVERAVQLPNSIPIHILYWTSWAEEGGPVHFRPDIYNRDKRLEEALQQKPPPA